MQVRYPFMTLNDDTEITYSSPIQNGDSIQVRVDMKTPIGNGFKSASCILPGYQWTNNGYIISGFCGFGKVAGGAAHIIKVEIAAHAAISTQLVLLFFQSMYCFNMAAYCSESAVILPQ